MNPKQCPSQKELSGYANGTLPAAAADEVTEHIAACATCEDTLQNLGQSADGLLRQIQAKPTVELYVEESACRQAVSHVVGNQSAAEGRSSGSPAPASPTAGNPAPERAKTMNRNEFVEFVTTSGLITADELTATIKSRPPAETSDAPSLAKSLVQLEKLTKYQAAAIYQGKGKSLFYGDYLVLDRIGAGGMGQVFKARHRRMDRIVALKVMSQAAIKNADSVRRFEREVRAAAKLVHPNVVHAYDAGVQDDVRYLVMEYVEGCDLSALMKQHPKLGIKQTCGFIEQAARGFAAAHAKGIVHRDVKPGNLLIEKSGIVKVLDMGLARFDDEGIGGAMTEGELTQSGSVMGTVDYMAPEQALDTRHADAKSDVYGLGCTLYRALAGEPVYGGRTLVEKILAHRDQPVPSIRKLRPDAPPQLDALLQRMMAKNPADRPTMSEVAGVLSTLDPTAKPGPVEAPIMPTASGGLPSPTGNPSAVALPTGGFGLAPSFNPPQVATAPRTAGAAPPRKKSILPLLAAAGAGGLLILGGVWVYIKDKDGKNVAVVEVPEGGSVQVVPNGTPPTPITAVVTPAPANAPLLTLPAANAATTPTTPFALPVRYVDADAERRAAFWVLSLGGTLQIAAPGSPPLDVQSAEKLPSYPFAIHSINLHKKKSIVDKDLELLRNTSNLYTLNLTGSSISDAGLDALKGLTTLQNITLSEIPAITDAGILSLAGLPTLATLRVTDTKVTAAGADALHNKVPSCQVSYSGGTTGSGPISVKPHTIVFRNSSEKSNNTASSSTASNGTASSSTGLVVCTKLIARRDPIGLLPDAIHFAGPPIDRSGANGFAIKAPADWRTAGTTWTFDYRCNQWDNGIQMIHPVGGGHMRMVLMTNFLGLAPGGPWGIEGIMKYYLPKERKLEPLASTVFPLNDTDTYRVKSVCDAAGNYTLSINDQVIVKQRVGTVSPQQMKPPFEDPKCPDVIAVGDAALIIGPAASPGAGVTIFNEANDVRLTTAGPALVASATPASSTTPPTASNPNERIVDPAIERRAAQKIQEIGGTFSFTTPDGPNVTVKPGDPIPSHPFAIIGINLNHKKATDKDLEAFVGLGNVKELTVFTASVSDAGLRSIATLTTMERMQLPGETMQFTDAGLQALGSLKRLGWLDLNGSRITAAGAEALHKKLPQCNVLFLPKGELPGTPVPKVSEKLVFKSGTGAPTVATVSDGWTALIPLAEVGRDTQDATWKVTGESAQFGASKARAIVWFPHSLESNYDVDTYIKITRSKETTALTLPIGDAKYVVLDLKGDSGNSESPTATAKLNGIRQATTPIGDAKMNINTEYRFTARVRVAQPNASVEIDRDGRPLFRWTGTTDDLTGKSTTFRPKTMQLETAYYTTSEIRELRVRPNRSGSPIVSTSSRLPATASAVPKFAPAPSVSAKDRKPAPAAAEQQSALKSIKEIFADDFAAAKTPEQKAGLAARLIDQARQTLDDAAARYVLLTEARELAIEAGALEVLNDALNPLIDEFTVDGPSMRLDGWNALLKRPRVDPTTTQQLAKMANSLFDLATSDADFEVGKRYGDFALSVTRRLPNSAGAVKLVAERNAALAARQKEWPTVTAAVEKLKTSPDDAEANLTLARYHGLSADDWPAAFPLYAKSGDETLKVPAEKSIAALAGSILPAVAGDVWWDAAQPHKAPQKNEYLAAADFWYRHAASQLSGLSKTRVEKRIAEIETLIPTRKIVASNLPGTDGGTSKTDVSGDERAFPNRSFGEPAKK